MSTRTAPSTQPRTHDRTIGWTAWRRLAAVSLAAAVVADVGLMAVHTEVVPPLVAFGLVGLTGAVLLPRGGRSGPILVGLAALVPLLVGAPLFLPGLAHPASPVDFLHGAATLLFRGTALGSVVALLRGATDGGARPVGASLAVLAAVAVAVSGIAALTVPSDSARAGDVAIGAEASRWSDGDITVASGGAIIVDNGDPFRHTFTVDAVGLDVELPANTARRIVLDVEPGSYTLRCAVPGHEDMLATIDVR